MRLFRNSQGYAGSLARKDCLLLLGTAGGPRVDPVAMTPQELAKRCGLVFQFPERYFLGGTLQDVNTLPASCLTATVTCNMHPAGAVTACSNCLHMTRAAVPHFAVSQFSRLAF